MKEDPNIELKALTGFIIAIIVVGSLISFLFK